MVELQECVAKLTVNSIDDGGDCRVYRRIGAMVGSPRSKRSLGCANDNKRTGVIYSCALQRPGSQLSVT